MNKVSLTLTFTPAITQMQLTRKSVANFWNQKKPFSLSALSSFLTISVFCAFSQFCGEPNFPNKPETRTHSYFASKRRWRRRFWPRRNGARLGSGAAFCASRSALGFAAGPDPTRKRGRGSTGTCPMARRPNPTTPWPRCSIAFSRRSSPRMTNPKVLFFPFSICYIYI